MCIRLILGGALTKESVPRTDRPLPEVRSYASSSRFSPSTHTSRDGLQTIPVQSSTRPPSTLSSPTHPNRSEVSGSGPHGPSSEVIIAISASLGLLLLTAVSALLIFYLRRMYRRHRLCQFAQRARPSELCAPTDEVGSANNVDTFQRSTSRDTHRSTSGHSLAVPSSVIDIAGPRTSIFVSPPSSLSPPCLPKIPQHSSPPVTAPRPSRERNGPKAAAEPIPGSAIVQDPPVSPPAGSVIARRSGVSGGSPFVTVLMEVPDEEERDLPPPYQPRPQATYDH